VAPQFSRTFHKPPPPRRADLQFARSRSPPTGAWVDEDEEDDEGDEDRMMGRAEAADAKIS
jgi:hypothetical protein